MPAETLSRFPLAVIVAAQFLGTSLWFSVNGVGLSLGQELGLTETDLGRLTIATQAGFILGTLALAATGLADRFRASRVFAVAAVLGALINGAFVLVAWQPAAALVMLADSCEAATRASSDRSAERIRVIVGDTFRERIDEGEFDESPISLQDLGVVRETYVSTLPAVFHPRVEYPAPTSRELEARGRSGTPARSANGAAGASEGDAGADIKIEPPEPRRAAVDAERLLHELSEDDS